MAEESLETLRRAHTEFWTGLFGLTLAFREKYGDEVWEVLKNFMGRVGHMDGEAFKEKTGIEVKGPEDLKRLMKVLMKESYPYIAYSLKVEGNKIITVTDATTCPMPEIAKTLGLPLRTVCENMAFPHTEAMLRTFNIKHTSKELSETRCVDECEII